MQQRQKGDEAWMNRMRECPHCGASIPSNAERCFYCGRRIAEDTGVRTFIRSRESAKAVQATVSESRNGRIIPNGLDAILARRKEKKGKEERTEAVIFTFAPGIDDGYMICGIADAVSEELILPDCYQGKTVTEIGPGSFRGLNMTKVFIPSSVRRIDEGAFENCEYLFEVAGGEEVRLIGKSAFRGCCSLARFSVLEAGNMHIHPSSFSGCYQLGLSAESTCGHI